MTRHWVRVSAMIAIAMFVAGCSEAPSTPSDAAPRIREGGEPSSPSPSASPTASGGGEAPNRTIDDGYAILIEIRLPDSACTGLAGQCSASITGDDDTVFRVLDGPNATHPVHIALEWAPTAPTNEELELTLYNRTADGRTLSENGPIGRATGSSPLTIDVDLSVGSYHVFASPAEGVSLVVSQTANLTITGPVYPGE